METLKKLKSSFTKLTKDFLPVANAWENREKYDTLKALLSNIEVNNEKIYDLLEDEELEEAMGKMQFMNNSLMKSLFN